MDNSEICPRPRPGVRFEKIDGEAVVYDRTGTKATYLNETAAIIWQLCDGVRTETEIIAHLADAYPEAGAALAADVRRAIADLLSTESLVVAPRETALAPTASL